MEMEQQVSLSMFITPERARVLHKKELEIDCNQLKKIAIGALRLVGQLVIAISNHNFDCNLDCQ
jgi:hypothetical protein